MTNQEAKKITLSNNEKGLLIASAVIMTSTIPITYVFFLIPLLNLPIVLLVVLVLVRVIPNPVAIRVVQLLAISGSAVAVWLTIILLNWQVQ